MSEQQNAAATVEDLTVDQSTAKEVKGGAQTDYLLLVDGIAGESKSKTGTPTVSEVVVTKLHDI